MILKSPLLLSLRSVPSKALGIYPGKDSPPHQDIDTDTSLDLEVQIPLDTVAQSLNTSSPHTRPEKSHTRVGM